jgi:hypothetical protein
MINIKRTTQIPSSLQNPDIQQYLDDLAAYKQNPSLPKPEPPASYRNSDVLEAFDECFFGKCYLTEEKFANSWIMDIDHFIPKQERPDLRYEWTNLYPCEHHANMARPRKTPTGGYLDPCNDDVEKEILYYLPIGAEKPEFEAKDATNAKAVNTAQLLDLLHNGKDKDSIERTKHLRFLIRKKYDEVIHAILAWKDAKAKGDTQEEFIHGRDLKHLLSRKSSFTMLVRSMKAVQMYVPKDFLD